MKRTERTQATIKKGIINENTWSKVLNQPVKGKNNKKNIKVGIKIN